jgi:hypothetical protein
MSVAGLYDAREGSVELPDCALAARQRAPLIAVERNRPHHGVTLQGRIGEEGAASASHARDIDLCRRDPARHLEALPAGIGSCNRARQCA